MLSLCGNSFGCLTLTESQIGSELSMGDIERTCTRCEWIAKSIIELMCNAPIEWCIDEWIIEGTAMEKLSSMMLFQLLVLDLSLSSN